MKENQVGPGVFSGTEDPGTSTGTVEEHFEKPRKKELEDSVSGEACRQLAAVGQAGEEERFIAAKTCDGGDLLAAKTPPQADKLGMTSLGGTEKARRSGRVSKEIAILLFGHDSDGRVFTEETHTVVLSLHGAGIVSRQLLIPEQELVLRWKDAERETDVRVVGEIAQQGGLHTYGVAFADDTLDFWQMEFPEPPKWQERPAVLQLECSGCRELVELTNGDFEYDICAIHGGLTRYCEDCGLLTVWRQPSEAMPGAGREVRTSKRLKLQTLERQTRTSEDQTVDPPRYASPRPKEPNRSAAVELGEAILPIAQPAAEKEQDRRSRVRAKVNFFACLKSAGYGEEVVRCIDMAKGGVSFRSRNRYERGTVIEIAVPYAADVREAPAIFVKARIANARAMPDGEMYRVGVEFLR